MLWFHFCYYLKVAEMCDSDKQPITPCKDVVLVEDNDDEGAEEPAKESTEERKLRYFRDAIADINKNEFVNGDTIATLGWMVRDYYRHQEGLEPLCWQGCQTSKGAKRKRVEHEGSLMPDMTLQLGYWDGKESMHVLHIKEVIFFAWIHYVGVFMALQLI